MTVKTHSHSHSLTLCLRHNHFPLTEVGRRWAVRCVQDPRRHPASLGPGVRIEAVGRGVEAGYRAKRDCSGT